MEDINPQINYTITECRHQFHTSCILKNINQNGFDCPNCRTTMIEHSTQNPADDDEQDEPSDDSVDEVTLLRDREHDASRAIGLPSPYDLCVELHARFGISMIDLIRLLLLNNNHNEYYTIISEDLVRDTSNRYT